MQHNWLKVPALFMCVMVLPVISFRVIYQPLYRTRVEFEAEGVEAGMYYIRLMDNATVMKEVAVKVD